MVKFLAVFCLLLFSAGCASTLVIEPETPEERKAARELQEKEELGLLEQLAKKQAEQEERRRRASMTLFEICTEGHAWKRYGSMKQCLIEKRDERLRMDSEVAQRKQEEHDLLILQRQQEERADRAEEARRNAVYNAISNNLGNRTSAGEIYLQSRPKTTNCRTVSDGLGGLKTSCQDGY